MRINFFESGAGFIKKAFSFVGQPSHSRTMGLVVMLLLAVTVSITVAASQQQQQTKQQAADPEVCSATDIPTCSSNDPANIACDSEGAKCKIGNKIYECKKK